MELVFENLHRSRKTIFLEMSSFTFFHKEAILQVILQKGNIHEWDDIILTGLCSAFFKTSSTQKQAHWQGNVLLRSILTRGPSIRLQA